MSVIRHSLHGVAIIAFVIVNGMLESFLTEQLALLEAISELATYLLIAELGLPIERQVAAIAVPVGLLSAIWLLLWEVKLVQE